MNNFLSRTNENDRFRTNANDEFQVQYLCEKLGYPSHLILTAIQEVGFDEDEVEEYIRDREERGLELF